MGAKDSDTEGANRSFPSVRSCEARRFACVQQRLQIHQNLAVDDGLQWQIVLDAPQQMVLQVPQRRTGGGNLAALWGAG